jgi:hypothetical protein
MQGWSWPIDCDQLLYNQCIKEGTMSALEQMVLEKFRQLEAKQQQQVLDFLEQLQQKQVAEFDYEAWQASFWCETRQKAHSCQGFAFFS